MKIIIRDSEHGKRETYNVREIRQNRKPALKDDKDEELSALEKRLDSLEEKLNELLSKDEGDEDEEADKDEDEEEADDEEVDEETDEPLDEDDEFEGERVEDVKTTCDSVRRPVVRSQFRSIGSIAKKKVDDSTKDSQEDLASAWGKYYDSQLKGDN